MNVLRAAILLLFAGAALPPLGAAPAERTISVNLKNADVRQVVAYILRGTDVNYALSGDVSGRVTCGLNDVPVERALQAILSAAGCEAVEDEGALLIRKCPPPPEVKPAVEPTPAAPPTGGEPREAAEVKAPRQEPAGANPPASAPVIYYVVMPAPQAEVPVPQPQAPVGYVAHNPHLTAAYEWLRNYGAVPAGMAYHPLGYSPGAWRPSMAWMSQAAANALVW